MKKIVNYMLVALMFVINFGFILNVNAIDVSTDTGVITITGVNSGDSLSAYKVLDTNYNSGTNSLTYSINSGFQAFLNTTSGTAHDYSAWDADDFQDAFENGTVTIEEIASAYAIYIKGLGSAPANASPLTTTGTTAVSGNLAPGTYMILPTSSTKVYAVMVGNIEYEAGANNTYVLKNNGQVSIQAKAETPTITASFRETTSLLSTSYNLNDTITVYAHVVFPAYPEYAVQKPYSVSVDFSNGAYQNIDLTGFVVNKGTANEYVATIDNGNISIGGNVVDTYTVSNGVITITPVVANNTAVTVDFTFTANFTNAVTAGVNQPITATLEFTTEPYASGTTTSSVTLNATTYGINIYLKETGSSSPEIMLTGGKYIICSDSSCNTVISTVTTDNGLATLFGVKAGVYYVKETQVPSGYVIDNTIYSISVGESEFEDPLHTGYYKKTLTNDKSAGLPSTGGVGTIIYTMLGLLIVALAALLISASKNKKEVKVENV